MEIGGDVSLVSALLLAVMAVAGLCLVVAGRSPVPWSSWRRVERHWVRAYGGLLVLLAAFEDNRRARR